MPSASRPPSRLTKHHAVPQPLFDLRAEETADTFVIRLRGELDLADCPRLDRAVAESEASAADTILLDLEELTFIDAAGLYSLAAASERSAVDGARLRMTEGSGQVSGIFELTSLDRILPLGSRE